MIRIIWPTIRPNVMKKTWSEWLDNAVHPEQIRIKVAVNTEREWRTVSEFDDVLIIGTKKRGPCQAVHRLSTTVAVDPGDILILASDDFYPRPGWDAWVLNHFEKFDGALMVNDGLQTAPILTIPILTYNCFMALNRVLNHPSYHCCRADVELFDNLFELGMIKNLRRNPVMFEHRHYSAGKREKDENDTYALKKLPEDRKTYVRRMKMSLDKRLNHGIG